MVYPDMSMFAELGRCHRRVPVTMEMEGDIETPIALFRKLCPGGKSYLLESVEGGEKWGRYSFIGRRPFAEIVVHDNRVDFAQGSETTTQYGDVLRIVDSLVRGCKVAAFPGLPDFSGGAVGYFGYDIVRSYERLPGFKEDDRELPDIHLMLTDELVVYDHLRQKVQLIVLAPITADTEADYAAATSRLESLRQEIENSRTVREERAVSQLSTGFSSTETEASYRRMVLKAKDYIQKGDIFQVVLSQRLAVETDVDPFTTYRVLRSLNPSPYLFFIDFEDYQLVGSSPELLVKVKDDHVETCPIAGTRRRGRDAGEDAALAQELLNDEKERAEHLMLVDLGRNDLGKVSEFGTVEAKNLMHVEKYSHVMHIVTNVVGVLRKDCGMHQALQACLPAGTLSGAPKVRAMEIIDELETKKRGPYAGAVGYLGFNGSMDVCITIRTLVFQGDTAYVQAGAGIVADSQPAKEYEESLGKARALLEAIRQAEARSAPVAAESSPETKRQ